MDWAEWNAELKGDSWAAAEGYPAGDTAELAQLLWDQGLLYLINREVLHPHGLALGVDHQDGKVGVLFLARTNDPDGIDFDPRDHAEGEAKLHEAGYLDASR